MGYYSEVSIILHPSCRSMIDDIIKKYYQEKAPLFLNNDTILKHVIENIVIPDKIVNGYILYYFDWIKWYDSFDLVILFNELFEKTDPDNFCFCRIGEEYGDIEYFGNLSSSMDIDCPFEITPSQCISISEND